MITPQHRSELINAANAILREEINPIEGCRLINRLRHNTGIPDDDVFLTIRAIDSETDHFPLGETRRHCSSEYLARADAEMHSYLDHARQDIFRACEEIVKRFSIEP